MIKIEDLAVKNWVKSIAFDYDLEEELRSMNIIMQAPNIITPLNDWIIKKITLNKSKNGKEFVIFYGEFEHNGEKKVQKLKMFTPYFPRTKQIEDYLGGIIKGASILCGIQSGVSKSDFTLVVNQIRIVKKDDSKSNPITKKQEDMSYKVFKSSPNSLEKDYMFYPNLSAKEFFYKFYPDRKEKLFFKK